MAIFQRTLTATAAAATVFAALALPVWAQAPAAPATTATTSLAAEPGAAHAKAPGHHQHRGHEAHGKRLTEKTAKLQAALQLTDAQQAGWTHYREALQPTPRAKPFDRESFAKLTTPERIDQMRQMRSERNAQAERRGEATKVFYATLTPAQQKTFDAQTLHHGKQHRGHPGARHHDQHGKHHAPAAAAQSGAPAPAPVPAK